MNKQEEMILYDVSATGIQTGTPEFVKLLTERIAKLPAELQMKQTPMETRAQDIAELYSMTSQVLSLLGFQTFLVDVTQNSL